MHLDDFPPYADGRQPLWHLPCGALPPHVLCFFLLLQAIITALGVDRRNRVLAGLYMGRSDTQLVVRQASLHVWKIVVSNTPRTLREILPTLFGLLLGFLASTCADKRTVSFLDLASDQVAVDASFQRLEG